MAVVSVRCNGRVLRFLLGGDTAAELLSELKGVGYEGRLELNGVILARHAILVDGETYDLVGKEDRSWFVMHDRMPSASALAANAFEIKRFMGGDDPVYDLCRVSAALPLELTVDAFGGYITAFKSQEPKTIDWGFVNNVMEMSDFFDDEKQREVLFGRYLQSYLLTACPRLKLRFTYSTRGRSMRVEARIAGEWITIAMIEVKAERLGAETLIEVMKYYGDHTKLLYEKEHWTYQLSCCPVLMIELAGPHIRVGGAARYIDKPAYQPFTPFLHIYKFLEDADHLSTLSRALASIGDAIKNLVQFYYDLSTLTPSRQRVPELEWPSKIRTLRAQGATIKQSTRPEAVNTLRLMNIGRSKQLVFGVEQPGMSRRLIKFSQRYGVDIHRSWAAEGYAPQFTCESLPGGWFMIDMEFYCTEDGWFPFIVLDPCNTVIDGEGNQHQLQPVDWEACKKAVIEAYKTLHAKFPLMVHGDLRQGNIFYNPGTRQVAFIDFDWAGHQGQDLYPQLINMRIDWPDGVGPCKPMRVQHDWQVLAAHLGVPPIDLVRGDADALKCSPEQKTVLVF